MTKFTAITVHAGSVRDEPGVLLHINHPSHGEINLFLPAAMAQEIAKDIALKAGSARPLN